LRVAPRGHPRLFQRCRSAEADAVVSMIFSIWHTIFGGRAFFPRALADALNFNALGDLYLVGAGDCGVR
jgi:hypothetical protein